MIRELEVEFEMPFRIEFCIDKGQPGTWNQPYFPDTVDIQAIYLYDIPLTAYQEKLFVEEYGESDLHELLLNSMEDFDVSDT